MRNYCSSSTGSIAPIFALSLAAIIGVIATTLALASDSKAANKVQITADSAAIAGATAFATLDTPKADERLQQALKAAENYAVANSEYTLVEIDLDAITEDSYGQQTTIDGKKFAPRKGKKKRRKMLTKIMRQAQSKTGTNHVEIGWPNNVAGQIAYRQQHGAPAERWTANKVKRIRQRYENPNQNQHLRRPFHATPESGRSLQYWCRCWTNFAESIETFLRKSSYAMWWTS